MTLLSQIFPVLGINIRYLDTQEHHLLSEVPEQLHLLSEILAAKS